MGGLFPRRGLGYLVSLLRQLIDHFLEINLHVPSGARERTQPPFLQLNWRFSAALCLANLSTQGLVFNSYLKKV